MKRYLISLLCFIGIITPLLADNVIALSSASGRPGDEIEIKLSLQNSDDVVAAEVKIPLGNYLKFVDGSAALNNERSNGHILSVSSSKNELRLYIYSITNNKIRGNNGTLATFRLKLGNNAEKILLSPAAILSSGNGESINNDVQTGEVTILAPLLTITNQVVDYGHVPIRSTYSKNLVLKNSGTATLHVNDITFSAEELSSTDISFEIAPNSSHTVKINYAPVKHGAISETITFVTDAINEERTLNIVADPYSVNELYIGSAEGNSDTEVSVDITLKNMEPIMAAQWTFTLPDALKYIDGSVIVGSHAEGLSVSAMTNDNKLTIFMYSHNNTAIPEGNGIIATLRLNLQGQSGYYSLTPSNITLSNIAMVNMVSASSSGTIRIKSPRISANTSLVMPKQPVTQPVTQTFSVRNSGLTDLTISKVVFLKDGFNIIEELPLTISPNTTKDITVRYNPLESGSYSTTMLIYSNDPLTRLMSVAVTGTTFEPNIVSISGKWNEDKCTYIANISVDNYTELVAVQMDVHIPEGASIDDVANALINTSRLDGLLSTIAKIDDTTYRIVVFSMSNSHIKGNNGVILSVRINVEDAYSMGGKEIAIDNIILSDASSKNFSSANMANHIITYCYISGDVNGDGKITAQDVTMLTNKTLDATMPANFIEKAADLNEDGKINAQDLTLLTNKTLE